MASEVQICNRALQKLGAKRITSLTEDTPNARSCNVAYASRRDALLRRYRWSFALTRVALSADVDTPAFGRAYSYTLPADFIFLVENYPEELLNDKDWIIEGKKIYTNDAAPLNVRYVYRVTDPNEMDPLFQEALSADLANELCEEITQSNTKKATTEEDAKQSILEARKAGAIEKIPVESATDTWQTVRA